MEYYYRMLSTGRRGKIDDSGIIKYIINGLNDEDLRKTLTAMNNKSCTKLFITLTNISEKDKIRNNFHGEQQQRKVYQKILNKDQPTYNLNVCT